jgi:hypothetical protein
MPKEQYILGVILQKEAGVLDLGHPRLPAKHEMAVSIGKRCIFRGRMPSIDPCLSESNGNYAVNQPLNTVRHPSTTEQCEHTSLRGFLRDKLISFGRVFDEIFVGSR